MFTASHSAAPEHTEGDDVMKATEAHQLNEAVLRSPNPHTLSVKSVGSISIFGHSINLYRDFLGEHSKHFVQHAPFSHSNMCFLSNIHSLIKELLSCRHPRIVTSEYQ